jgi:hypothetical protein
MRSTTERRNTREVQAHNWFSDPDLQVARNEITCNVETRALLITHPYLRKKILRCSGRMWYQNVKHATVWRSWGLLEGCTQLALPESALMRGFGPQ